MICSCRDLKLNKLTGQIPDEIGDCVSLKYLYVPKSSKSSFIVLLSFRCRLAIFKLVSVFFLSLQGFVWKLAVWRHPLLHLQAQTAWGPVSSSSLYSCFLTDFYQELWLLGYGHFGTHLYLGILVVTVKMGGCCICCSHDYNVWCRHLLRCKKFACLWFVSC